MKNIALAASIISLLLSGCSNVDVRYDETSGILPANSVPDSYKAGVADYVHQLQGGAPRVVGLRVSKPANNPVLTTSWVEVGVKLRALYSIGEPQEKCYLANFNNEVPSWTELEPARLNGCTGGMEDMLAFYQARYPG